MFRRTQNDDAPKADNGETASLRLGLTNAESKDSAVPDKDTKDQTKDDTKAEPSTPAPLKPFARKGSRGAMAPSSPSAASVQSAYRTPSGTEIPRRPVASSRATRAGNAPSAANAADDSKRLIVGREICLTGEISACDTLVVQGRVEAHLSEARLIEVASSGIFRGHLAVQEADISGRCEGELTVTGTLIVREGGRIEGKTRYGTLVVEAGGYISGTIEVLEADQDAETTTKDDNGDADDAK